MDKIKNLYNKELKYLKDAVKDGKSPYQAEMIIDTDWDEIGERPNLNRELWDNFVDKDTFYLKIFHEQTCLQ